MEDDEMAGLIDTAPRDIAGTIKRLRIERGLSQEALAKRMQGLGLGSWRQSTVAKVEAQPSPRALTVQEAVGLAVALGLSSLDELLSPDLEVGMYANALDLQRADFVASFERGVSAVEKVLDAGQFEHFKASARGAFDTSELDKAIEGLKRRKADSVHKRGSTSWRQLVTEELSKELES